MSIPSSIRVYAETAERMRLATMEIALAHGRTFRNDDERVNALVEHFHTTKQSLAPAAQDAAGVSTPSPRQG